MRWATGQLLILIPYGSAPTNRNCRPANAGDWLTEYRTGDNFQCDIAWLRPKTSTTPKPPIIGCAPSRHRAAD